MGDLPVVPSNVLDWVGGFDAYQNRLYGKVMDAVRERKVGEVERYDVALMQFNSDYNRDGLSNGLLGLVSKRAYITEENFNNICPLLNLSKDGIFFEELESYVTELANSISEKDEQRRKFLAWWLVTHKIWEESDRIIQERRSKSLA